MKWIAQYITRDGQVIAAGTGSTRSQAIDNADTMYARMGLPIAKLYVECM